MSPPGRSARLRRDHRQARVAVPHGAASRRVRLRDLAEGRLEVHRRRQHVGRDHRRREARHRVLPDSARPPTTSTAPTAPAPTCSADCLLALDARTGKRLWHFQMVAPRPLGLRQQRRAAADDHQAGTARTIDVVALAGKTGFLYVFDRVTGEPIWPIEERPVPKSDMPGEQSWPTQPFPTAPPPFGRQTFTADDINPVSDRQRRGPREVQAAPRGVAQSGTVHADSFRRHAAHPGQQRRRALRLHGGRADQRHGLRHQPGQPGHPPPREEPAAGRPAGRRGIPA